MVLTVEAFLQRRRHTFIQTPVFQRKERWSKAVTLVRIVISAGEALRFIIAQDILRNRYVAGPPDFNAPSGSRESRTLMTSLNSTTFS